MNFCTFPLALRISSSISTTSWLAPPCNGPHKAQTPAETDAYRLAQELPTSRTAEVLQFCSWSACKIKSVCRALTAVSLIRYSFLGVENIMCRKFGIYRRSARGGTNGCLTDFRYV